MAECVVFDHIPSESEREAWCRWLRHHGIDPNLVALPGWIERDEQRCRITYDAYLRDRETGRYVLTADREPVRAAQVHQLEARPSPFPNRLRPPVKAVYLHGR